MARGLEFCIQEVEGLFYLCSESKGADQLRGYREADLRLCFRNAKNLFSHDAAQFALFLLEGEVTFPYCQALAGPLFQASITICFGCTAPFALDLVGNPEDRFSHDTAQIIFIPPGYPG